MMREVFYAVAAFTLLIVVSGLFDKGCQIVVNDQVYRIRFEAIR